MSEESPYPESASTKAAASWEAEIGPVRVLFGQGRMLETSEVVRTLGCRRVLLVSDPGIRAAGHLGKLQTALGLAELEVLTFDKVAENPTTEQVEVGLDFAAPHKPDCVVALGGGSAMDCAKGINFLLTNGGRMSDYRGFGRAGHPLLPAIGIPTTAGTGSEAQSFALISDSNSHEKMACGDPSARFRAVILDPTLLSSAPVRVAAASGLDAVSHAIESFVSTRCTPISRLLASHAWELLDRYLDRSLSDHATIQERGQVLLAAHLAGAAIEQSMLGAAHACANPLTATFGIAHGQAVALMLPHVVRFNSEVVANDYLELAVSSGLDVSAGGASALANRLEEMRRHADLPERLQQLEVSKGEIQALAAAATREWTAGFNPRPVSQSEIEFLYESAY